VSLEFIGRPAVAVAILLGGRALLGVGESFIITGAQSWGLSVVGIQNTGRVLAWVGSAMFAAFALGAPIGSALYTAYGFSSVALSTTILPFGTLLFIAPLTHVPATPRVQPGVLKVMAAVWVPGVASALSSIGFGAIIAFSPLLLVARGWAAWPAFSVFAAAFILSRMFLGHLADRFGGAKVALVSVLIEAGGLALVGHSASLALALIGAGWTGLGYSLVYPGFGVEAVRSAPAQSRGLAMGAYTAFLDLALGLGTPALGLVADFNGLSAVFATSMLAALGSAAIGAAILSASRVRHDAGALACPCERARP
jgi:MFS family permease